MKKLYEIVDELERRFPGRRFTLDGHIVGSLGEVLAEYRYDLELFTGSTECRDAKARDGRLVQIKAAQGTRGVALRSSPKHLIVLQIMRDGSAEEVFNGPGELAWSHAGRRQKNGQCSIGLAKLRNLMTRVPDDERLPLVNG
ncbi:MAG: DUF6998 domain-containing protein [Rubrobacteraceae bacterium]